MTKIFPTAIFVVMACSTLVKESDNRILAGVSRAAFDEEDNYEAISKEAIELLHEIDSGECSEETPEHCCPHCHLCPLCSRCDGSTNDLEACKFCDWCHLCKDHCGLQEWNETQISELSKLLNINKEAVKLIWKYLHERNVTNDGSESIAEQHWRPDGHCGYRFPINGRSGECDPSGKNPCCSNYGWCGNTENHCRCIGCKDYRIQKGTWLEAPTEAPYYSPYFSFDPSYIPTTCHNPLGWNALCQNGHLVGCSDAKSGHTRGVCWRSAWESSKGWCYILMRSMDFIKYPPFDPRRVVPRVHHEWGGCATNQDCVTELTGFKICIPDGRTNLESAQLNPNSYYSNDY